MRWLTLLKDTAAAWSEDSATTLGAALAYYSVFSLGPLLIIAISVAGAFFGEDAASGMLADQLSGAMGGQAAQAVEGLVDSARKANTGGWMTVVGLAALLFSASGIFGQLKESMNRIWQLEARPGRGIKGLVIDRFLSMSMVLGIGFLLLVSLILSAILAAANQYLGRVLPVPGFFWQIVEIVVSYGMVTLLFAMMFKILPDALLRWSDVWSGALITAFLFTTGKFLLALYLGRDGTASAYGVAGAMVLILLWVYYSSLILLFGAEFTKVLAKARGRTIPPNKNAVRMAGK